MKALILALGLALVPGVAFAQPDDGPQGEGKKGRLVKMQDELGLTDEQVEKMRAIRNAGGSREEMRAVLTPEQQAKVGKFRSAHKGDAEKRLRRMQSHLDLSDEQAGEIEKIVEEGGSREDVQNVLSAEQKAKLDKLRSQRKNHNLTPRDEWPDS